MISSIPTSDGQTTLPERVRNSLDLQPGDRIEYVLTGDRVELRRESADLTALDGMLDRSEQVPVPVDEMTPANVRGRD
ncbi:MAG: AbrB/MazE/SpoVT family DNA-binding domain-containing protein [Salinivenus sp.]